MRRPRSSPRPEPRSLAPAASLSLARLQVCEGEVLSGRISVAPNAKNPRDLDITLEYHFEGRHCEAHRTQTYRMR